MQSSSLVVFFFFQAEDGIRDVAVTGVQTCALPISPRAPANHDRALPHGDERGHGAAAPEGAPVGADLPLEPLPLLTRFPYCLGETEGRERRADRGDSGPGGSGAARPPRARLACGARLCRRRAPVRPRGDRCAVQATAGILG